MEQEIYKGFSGVWDAAPELVRGECVIDLTLPDYQPEIRRIYGVSASVRPSGKYVAAGKAEFAGTVYHTLLYGNADGGVSVLSLPGDYLLSFPCPDGCDAALLPVVADSPLCRLTGPRKLSIRTPLTAAARAYGKRESNPGLTTLTADPTVVTLRRPVTVHRCTLLSEGDLRLEDTVRFDGEGTLLSSDAAAYVREVIPTDGGIEVRGEAAVEIWLDRGGEVPHGIKRKIPFSATLPYDGEGTPDGTASAWVTVTSLDASASPSDGGGTAIALDLTLDLTAEICSPATEWQLSDLFSTEKNLSVSFETLDLSDVSFCRSGLFTIEGSAERSECNCEDAMTVVGSSACLAVTEKKVADGSLTVSGECRITSVVGSPTGDPDGGTVYSGVGFRFPFSLSVPLPAGVDPDSVADVTAVPVTVSVRLDPSRLLATVEVALLTRLTREKQITLVSGASDGDGERRTIQPGEIVAVYPDGDETLWGIAKKFGVPPAKIARENRLPDAAAESPDAPASLDGCVRLLLG